MVTAFGKNSADFWFTFIKIIYLRLDFHVQASGLNLEKDNIQKKLLL